MSRAPFIVIGGKPYRWKDILEQRRAQLAAAGAAQASHWRSLRPCTTTAGRPPSARHPGAICNRACSKIRSFKQRRATHDRRAHAGRRLSLDRGRGCTPARPLFPRQGGHSRGSGNRALARLLVVPAAFADRPLSSSPVLILHPLQHVAKERALDTKA
jgi:hypothetical protein